MTHDLLYPITIILDRYGGTYSGARWTAFNAEEAPSAAVGCDTAAAFFWDDPGMPVGKGNTPNEALADLQRAVSTIAELEAELAKVRAELDGHRDGRMQAEAMRDDAEADRDRLQRENEGLHQRVRDLTDALRVIRSRCSDEIAALSPAEPQEPRPTAPEGEPVYDCPACDGTGEGKTYSMNYSDIPLCRVCNGTGQAPETERHEAEGRQEGGSNGTVVADEGRRR